MFLSLLYVSWWTIDIICDSHDLFALNPCWNSNKILFDSRYFIMLLARMCSSNLHEIQVCEIYQQFPGRCLSPFLNTGVTFAWFQSDGTLPDCMEFLNMMVSMSEQIFIFSVSILPVMCTYGVNIYIKNHNALSETKNRLHHWIFQITKVCSRVKIRME
jgi:hypothetical protein